MVMQVRRTLSVGATPTGLAEGQISVGMADQPPTAWVGVPASVDPAGVIPITGLVRTVAGAPQPAGALGQLWWDEDAAQLFVYTGNEWVVAVNPPIPDLSGFVNRAQININLWVAGPGVTTYTPSLGLQYAVIEVCGAGGNGGGCWVGGGQFGGGGGGAGAYAQGVASAAQIGASQTVTRGLAGAPGGATSVGALLTADGGSAGEYADFVTTWGTPGAGGQTTGGALTTWLGLSGASGGWATLHANGQIVISGRGGGNYGSGGPFAADVTANPGGSNGGGAGAPGCGGGGAVVNQQTGAFSVTGGQGGEGWCVITEYCF